METVRLDREISQTTAPNGVIVLSERVASVRSAAVGIWVRSASAHEPRPKMGVSHLLEHMVFKGTARRTAQERSEEHTSELQSQSNLVCRLLLEKKKKIEKKQTEQATTCMTKHN